MVNEVDPEKKYEGIDYISMRMQGRAYNTLISYKKGMNFPMFKALGVWNAYEKDIAAWEEFQEDGKFFEDEDRPSAKKKKRARKSTKKVEEE